MEKTGFLLRFFLILIGGVCQAQANPYGPVTLVNPFVGTANGGNTFPGALVPWGMVSVSPHNDLQSPSGYISGRPFIYGFGHIHLSGTEFPDLGSVVLMPTTGPITVGSDSPKSSYSSEAAFPGYYKTRLTNFNVLAEMTASCRAGFSRYTFSAQSGDANILINASQRLTTETDREKFPFESSVKIISSHEVEGSSQSGGFGRPRSDNQQTLYFFAEFSKAAEKMGTWKDGSLSSGREQKGKDVGAFLRFSTAEGESIEVKVGLSYVSVENAKLNLETEIPNWDFESVMHAALNQWDQQLSKIEVSGGQDQDRRIFYTALYHALIHPSVFNDVNGQYQGMGHSGIKTVNNYVRYSVFPLWATYRTLHPLLALVYPQEELDMVKSLVEMGKENQWLPKWELEGNETGDMVGDPAVSVIAEAYLKGITEFDTASAYAEIQKSLNPQDNHLYEGMKSFTQDGFIPHDEKEQGLVWGSVSTSLEYSLAFWNLAQFAKGLGNDDDSKRAMNHIGAYRNLYDPSTHFFRAKNQDGSFIQPFDPLAGCCDQDWPGSGGPGYVEGTAWQYLFTVPQDVEGLKMILGGDITFTKRLQECFDKGYYDATNVEDLNDAYLFDYVPRSEWLTQKYVRQMMNQYYGPNADGIPGHDEAGTLSAWYLFSAMGFYPVCPTSLTYQLGSPLFQRVEIQIDKAFYPGDNLVIKTLNNSPKNIYLQSVVLKGIPTKSFSISHDDLTRGGTLLLDMGSEPVQ